MESPLVYLDYNASTPIDPEVLEAMLPHLAGPGGNPSATHILGRASRAAVDRAREQLAHAWGARPEEVFFTSGGTESNNLAIRGPHAAGAIRAVITSTLEHPAVLEPVNVLEAAGLPTVRLRSERGLTVDPASLDDALSQLPRPALVSVMHAHNEVGTIQPIQRLAEVTHRHDGLFHTDASQSMGKIAVRVDELGVDFLTIAGHKMYAPKGVGALYVRSSTRSQIAPLVVGAGHEAGLRPGTEDVASIVGLGTAASKAAAWTSVQKTAVAALRDELRALLEELIPELATNSREDGLPNTLHVTLPDVSSLHVLQQASDVAASTGSACHEGSDTLSALAEALGQTSEQARGNLRLTLGIPTTRHDVNVAAKSIGRAWRALRETRPVT